MRVIINIWSCFTLSQFVSSLRKMQIRYAAKLLFVCFVDYLQVYVWYLINKKIGHFCLCLLWFEKRYTTHKSMKTKIQTKWKIEKVSKNKFANQRKSREMLLIIFSFWFFGKPGWVFQIFFLVFVWFWFRK